MRAFGRRRAHGIMLALALAAVGCAPVEGDSDSEPGADSDLYDLEDQPGEVTEKAFSISNGLQSFNGLTSSNGLKTTNGLTANNGLKYLNGLMLLNGLTTKNGVKTFNGLSVNCAGTTSCTGEPDGLLSRITGLMRSAQGVQVAQYVARCALRSDQSIRVKRWDGALVTLTGNVGLAPEWLDGLCDSNCQERVSACMLALSNGKGEHVSVVLTSPLPQIGTGTLSTHPYHEGAYFGNLFDSPPRMFIYPGRDYTQYAAVRACSLPDALAFSLDDFATCMVRFVWSSCTMAKGMTLQSCSADDDAVRETTARTTYNNVITVWRSSPQVRPNTSFCVFDDTGNTQSCLLAPRR